MLARWQLMSSFHQIADCTPRDPPPRPHAASLAALHCLAGMARATPSVDTLMRLSPVQIEGAHPVGAMAVTWSPAAPPGSLVSAKGPGRLERRFRVGGLR